MALMIANDLVLRNPTKITLNFLEQQPDEEEKTFEEESKIEEAKEIEQVSQSQQDWEKLIDKELDLSEESMPSSQPLIT